MREDLVGKLGTTLVVTGYDHSFGREKYNAFDFLTKVGPALRCRGDPYPPSGNRGDHRQLVLGAPCRGGGRYCSGPHAARTAVQPLRDRRPGENNWAALWDTLRPISALRNRQNSCRPTGGVCRAGTRIAGGLRRHDEHRDAPPRWTDYPGRSIEVNLFDFDRDIYGQTLSVEILAWVRSEVKFSSLDNLKQQLAKDARRCRELLQASR